LIEVIACGRPGTEMPHFDKYAYEDKTCYGATAADPGQLLETHLGLCHGRGGGNIIRETTA
jgi:hypothetical protein